MKIFEPFSLECLISLDISSTAFHVILLLTSLLVIVMITTPLDKVFLFIIFSINSPKKFYHEK